MQLEVMIPQRESDHTQKMRSFYYYYVTTYVIMYYVSIIMYVLCNYVTTNMTNISYDS